MCTALFAEAETIADRPIAISVNPAQIVQQPPAAADHLQQPAARMMIFLMELEMLGQIRDPIGQDRDLHLGRACIALVGTELLDQTLLTV